MIEFHEWTLVCSLQTSSDEKFERGLFGGRWDGNGFGGC